MSPSHSVHAAHAYIFSQLTEFQDVSGIDWDGHLKRIFQAINRAYEDHPT